MTAVARSSARASLTAIMVQSAGSIRLLPLDLRIMSPDAADKNDPDTHPVRGSTPQPVGIAAEGLDEAWHQFQWRSRPASNSCSTANRSVSTPRYAQHSREVSPGIGDRLGEGARRLTKAVATQQRSNEQQVSSVDSRATDDWRCALARPRGWNFERRCTPGDSLGYQGVISRWQEHQRSARRRCRPSIQSGQPSHHDQCRDLHWLPARSRRCVIEVAAAIEALASTTPSTLNVMVVPGSGHRDVMPSAIVDATARSQHGGPRCRVELDLDAAGRAVAPRRTSKKSERAHAVR